MYATPEQIRENGPGNARNVIIPPICILSLSSSGIGLMDYKPRGVDELELRKDDRVKIYKRYNHWSYLCNESTADRGWVPSWL
jgi:protein STE50